MPFRKIIVWIHLASGLPGKIVATLATAASLFLVSTGFALSCRRSFRRDRSVSSPQTAAIS